MLLEVSLTAASCWSATRAPPARSTLLSDPGARHRRYGVGAGRAAGKYGRRSPRRGGLQVARSRRQRLSLLPIATATVLELRPIGSSRAADVVPMHRMQLVGLS